MRLHVTAPSGDDEDTIRLTPRAAASAAAAPRSGAKLHVTSKGRGKGLWIAASGGAAVLVVLLGWMLWPRAAPPPPPLVVAAPQPAPRPRLATGTAAPPMAASVAAAPVAAPPAFAIRTATRRQILADRPAHLAVFRYAANPNILVLDFPTLRGQGLMLDRVAALIEKSGLPRDHVVSWARLRRVITAGDDTIGTYYYGHDYSAAALARFFTLAAADHRALNGQEQRLYALLAQLGWLRPGVNAGLISLPREGANRYVTGTARDVILTHELSHGQFFSDPAYRAYVRHFWHDALTVAQRAAVRKFLGGEEYDTGDETLMMNEMQAYLMFTRNAEFFQARNIGMTPAERRALQLRFVRAMPPGWLRDRLETLNARALATVQIAPAADRRARSSAPRPSHAP